MKKKRKIGMVGYFATGKTKAGGQEAKTCAIADELIAAYGKEQVLTIDTVDWRKHPLRLFFGLLKIGLTCRNVIMLPAQKSLPIFASILTKLKRITKFKLHYAVVGGWLPERTKNDERLTKRLKKVDVIYAEASMMKETLEGQGFDNVVVMANFKDLRILDEKDLVYPEGTPLRLVTFSRITKEKGIGDAVSVVRRVNDKLGRVALTLDIYGNIMEPDQEWFETLKKSLPGYITYKGIAEPPTSVDVLKDYYALLFPTYYPGEGFAGTLLDAFASGIPVIASDWRYNKEIVNKRVGILYPSRDNDALEAILLGLAKSPTRLLGMKKACLEEAKRYEAKEAIKVLMDRLID